jgi:hypothetical protein
MVFRPVEEELCSSGILKKISCDRRTPRSSRAAVIFRKIKTCDHKNGWGYDSSMPDGPHPPRFVPKGSLSSNNTHLEQKHTDLMARINNPGANAMEPVTTSKTAPEDHSLVCNRYNPVYHGNCVMNQDFYVAAPQRTCHHWLTVGVGWGKCNCDAHHWQQNIASTRSDSGNSRQEVDASEAIDHTVPSNEINKPMTSSSHSSPSFHPTRCAVAPPPSQARTSPWASSIPLEVSAERKQVLSVIHSDRIFGSFSTVPQVSFASVATAHWRKETAFISTSNAVVASETEHATGNSGTDDVSPDHTVTFEGVLLSILEVNIKMLVHSNCLLIFIYF